MRVQEFKRPGVQQARSSGDQEFRRPAVQEVAAKSLSGGQGAAWVDQEDIVVQQSEVLEFVINNGGQAESSQRMEDDSSLKIF